MIERSICFKTIGLEIQFIAELLHNPASTNKWLYLLKNCSVIYRNSFYKQNLSLTLLAEKSNVILLWSKKCCSLSGLLCLMGSVITQELEVSSSVFSRVTFK